MHYQPTNDMIPGATLAIAPPLRVQNVMNLPLVDANADVVIRKLLDATRKTANFINAHCVNQKAKNRAYAAALGRTDYLLPDGVGIEMAAKIEGASLAENLNGTDFTPKMLHVAARLNLSVFLIGGAPGTAEAAARRLCLDIPGLRIAGTHNGYDDAERAEAVIADINYSDADIVLVAMGVPVQEIWIDRHRDALSANLVMGVGALFDFLAENVTRAPVAIRKLRMEWVWRLAMEPRRLAKRYLAGNATFLARTAWHAFKQRGRRSVAPRGLVMATPRSTALRPALPMGAVDTAVKVQSKMAATLKHARLTHAAKAPRPLSFEADETVRNQIHLPRKDILKHGPYP